jgi:hypothetical protein
MAPGGRIAICVATTILFRRALNISSLVFNHPLKPGQFGNTRIVKPVDFLEIQTQAGRERWYFLRGTGKSSVLKASVPRSVRAGGCYTK